ncbi:major facilitator superfamily domain-containing protein [Aspergillus keveii]|uniref:Major facilitator superfamily domain-containing protein n=1 Tax=Aspergillus keveii TaxID=714993 RepID=A0ABR4G820_9EURO
MIKNAQIQGRTVPTEYGHVKPAPKMQYVRLGDSGLKVSRLILGTATYGSKSDVAWRIEEEEALKHFQCLRNRVVLLCSLKLLSYIGCEVSLGGWIVTFMRRIRHGGDFQSGMVSSGFWAGITVGRMVLGFVTGRVFKSPKWAVIFYLSAAVAMHLCFWLIPNFMASAIFAAFLGFFLGPIFPCVILCLSDLLPSRMRVSAVGICSAVGASGASIIPFMVGAIAQAKGVAVLQPIILAFLVLCFIIWCFVPNSPKGL